jgi:hypothetical protein
MKKRIMKKIILPVLLTIMIAGLSVSCKKIISKVFNGFDADVPQVVVTIPYVPLPPGTPVPATELSLGSLTQSFNLDSTIKANTAGAFGAGDVSSIKIKKMVFTLLDPDENNNLSNFESARLTFASNTSTEPLPIASFTFPDTYSATQTFNADQNTPELKSYLTGSQLTYNVYGKIRRYTTKPLKLAVMVTLTVR